MMEVIAKIISIVIAIKGLFLMFSPGNTKRIVQKFKQIPDKYQRIFGVMYILTGAVIIYLTRIESAVPLVHWFVSVAGIYFVLMGLIITIIGQVIGKTAEWFYSEKGPTVLIGFILLITGMVLFILL